MTPVLLLRRVGRYVADNAIAVLALIIATSGAAYAANTVGSSDIIDDSILSADIKDNTLARKDMAWAKWQPVGPASGLDMCDSASGEFCSSFDVDRFTTLTWSNQSTGGYQSARFRRNATSEVAVQGSVRTNTDLATFQLPIFVLPPGYRPMNTLDFAVPCTAPGGGTNFGAIEVRSSGELFLLGQACATDGWVSLSGVSFPIG
jgi:hypothetical protein